MSLVYIFSFWICFLHFFNYCNNDDRKIIQNNHKLQSQPKRYCTNIWFISKKWLYYLQNHKYQDTPKINQFNAKIKQDGTYYNMPQGIIMSHALIHHTMQYFAKIFIKTKNNLAYLSNNFYNMDSKKFWEKLKDITMTTATYGYLDSITFIQHKKWEHWTKRNYANLEQLFKLFRIKFLPWLLQKS